MDAADYTALMEVLHGEPSEWTNLDEPTMRLRLQHVQELQGNSELDEETLMLLEGFHHVASSRLASGPPQDPTRPAPEYVGLSEAAAGQLADGRGVPFRVVERDGERFFITLDLVYGRINAAIAGGVVMDAREEYDHEAETLVRLVDLDVFAAAVEHRRSAWERRGVSVEFRWGQRLWKASARVVLEGGGARGQLTVSASGAAVMEVAREDSKDWSASREGATTEEEIGDLLGELETRVLA